MYKQAMQENIAAYDRARSDYSKGLCTFYELQHALRVLMETRKALIFDAYEQGDLDWVADKEKAAQVSTEELVRIIRQNKTGFPEFNSMLEDCACLIEAYMNADDNDRRDATT